MIYLTQSSLWWLILPALFTGTQNAIEMLKSVDEEDDLQLPTDEETKRKIAALLEQAKRGKL
jgi:hypothetical protein